MKMADLITSEHKHLLWKDEIGDDFLLLKYGEVYRYSETAIRLLTWSSSMCASVRRMTGESPSFRTDDGITVFDFPARFLPHLIALGAHRRRPHAKGRWLRDKEQRLGHRVLPYRPQLKGKS